MFKLMKLLHSIKDLIWKTMKTKYRISTKCLLDSTCIVRSCNWLLFDLLADPLTCVYYRDVLFH